MILSSSCIRMFFFKLFFIEIYFTYYKILHFIVNNSLIFSVFINWCSHHHYLITEHFLYPRNKLYPLAVTTHSPLPSALSNHLIYFLCLWIFLFWTSYLNGIIIDGLWHLVSFAYHNVFKVYCVALFISTLLLFMSD